MRFENLSVDLDQLPQVEAVEIIGLNKDYLDVSMTAVLFRLIMLWIVAILGMTIMGWWGNVWAIAGTGIGLLLFSIFVLLITKWGFKIKGYGLRQHDIMYRSGLIFRNITTVPFDRVQHAEVSQGPIDKIFGLSNLQVYTAGGQGSDLVVPGLRPEEANRVKAFILKRSEPDVD